MGAWAAGAAGGRRSLWDSLFWPRLGRVRVEVSDLLLHCDGIGGTPRLGPLGSRPAARSTRAPSRLGRGALRLAAVSCAGLDRPPSAGDAPGCSDCATVGFEGRLLAACLRRAACRLQPLVWREGHGWA